MATITGDDTSDSLVGTDSNDTITAKGGNDTINGMGGGDDLRGGLGDDTYEFSGNFSPSGSFDRIWELAGEGSDTIHILSDIPASSVRIVGRSVYFDGDSVQIIAGSYGTIHLNSQLAEAKVEWLQLGDSAPISLTGGLTMTGDSSSEDIKGTKFNDTINGMGGGDDLRGGLGDDTYEFSGNFSPSGSFDRIWELAGEGSDTIHILSDIPASSVRIVGRSVYFDGDSVQIIAGSYGTIHLNSQLAEAKVEWLQLGDSAPISLTGGLTMTGDSSIEEIKGTKFNDTINGMGGGDDLRGGLGDDTYEFSGNFSPSGSFDRIWELAGEGSDTIHILSDIPASTVRIVGRSVYFDGDSVQIIADGYGTIHLNSQLTEAKVEWLQLGDSAPISLTGGLTMTGDSSSESIKGTKFNDIINGMGGSDSLYGGSGDDVYIVNNAGVAIFEDLPNGNDTVNSTITYTLSANLETLNLVGTETINGTGNDLDNNLTGNSADNLLDGGLGKDIMSGGLGNDTYVIDNIDDVVTEKPDEGTDTVNSGITYALLPDFENLTLTGTTTINGTGNSLNNILIGNSAANELNGGEGDDNLSAGAGNDTLQAGFGHDDLTGGDGKDAFVFYSPGDFVVHDFKKSDDLLKFDSATTGLHDLESLLGVITHIDDTPEGVAVHFVYDIASITLIGIHPADLTASMVEFS